MGRSHRVCLDYTEGNEVEHRLSRLRDVIYTSTQVERYVQILGYININVRTEIPAVQYVLCAVTIIHFSTLGIPHTLLTQVREAHIVAGTLVTATNLQVGAVLWCSITIQLVCPRCIEVLVLADIIVSKRSTIAYILVVVELLLGVHRIHTAQIAYLVTGHRHVVRVLNLHLVGEGLETDFLSEINLSLTGITALGSNHNHTIGTTHTIDRRSGSILQYGDALDRISIEEGEVTLYVIHDNQWRTGTLVGGTDTTDKEETLRPSWLRRPLVGLHTIQC